MDPPSGGVPEQGPDWFLVATEACGGGTPDLGFFSGVSVFIGILASVSHEGGLRVVHEIGGRTQGVGRALHPRRRLGTLLAQLFYSRGCFWSIKNPGKLAGQLDPVWYSFSVKLKNKEKRHWALG